MVYGLSASLGYSFWEQFRAGLSASYSELRYEETGADHISYAADHPYSLSSTLGWAGESGLSLGLSYVNGNQLEQYGGIDFFIFDQYSSSWSVQAGYQF